MSQLPDIPEALQPLAPGYSPRQVQLDAEMVALGRPPLSMRSLVNPKALAAHRAEVEAWEKANPEAAVRWLELRSQARAEENRLYEEKFGPEAYAFEQLRASGFRDERALEAVRMANSVALRETPVLKATRDWLLDGVTWALVLTGRPGCGKTLAATWAAHQLLSRRRYAPRCVQCPKQSEAPLFGMEAEEYRGRCAEKADVLLLDDLGEGEQRNEKRSAWRGWVDDVLTQRHAARRKTIITTNRTIDELVTWLGPRLKDRLKEGIIISTDAPSMREPGEDG